jgi:hypothetical protein
MAPRKRLDARREIYDLQIAAMNLEQAAADLDAKSHLGEIA